jgi:hypothetical protein
MEKITCPHCKNDIAIITKLPRTVLVSAMCKDKNGKLYQPRERWEIDSSKIEETKNFVFRSWDDIAIMRFYDLDGNVLKEFRK